MSAYSDIVSSLRATLALTEPELDTSAGSVTRKILDAVAEQIAEASIDQHLLTYQYDIDSKVDADLDDFVDLFGMARLVAKRASGIVTFSRSGTSTTDSTVFLPVGTQVLSTTSPQIVVQTVAGAYMEPGILTVDVAVQAVDAGPAGNLAAGNLTLIGSPLSGVSSVTNVRPLSGGTAQETDNELRQRWKTTVFRNLAGTEQMYLGTALADADCYVANVVGPSKRRREQVQIVSGVGQTTVDDAAYIYTDPVFVGANVDGGDIAIKGIDYTWNTSVNPPKVDVVSSTALPNGAVVEVDFEYLPKASRNDPSSAITNRVDIWVGGSRARSAVQALAFRRATNLRFSSSSSDPMYRQRFLAEDLTYPATGNFFVPLAWGPIISVPSVITINGVTYGKATDAKPLGTIEVVGGATIIYAYRVVHEDGAFGYSPTSRFGLEWWVDGTYPSAGTKVPPNNAVFSIGGESGSPYLYNGMIQDISAAVENWRLLGVDAQVHQAKSVALRLNLAIMYEARANPTVVDSEIDLRLSEFFMDSGFQGRVQVSDLLQVVHNVVGVDNVRFLRGSDHSGYNSAAPNNYNVGIQQMVGSDVVASYVDSTGRPQDIRFGDDELPIFHSATKSLRAENSFGSL